jgi:hypothetical protein
MANDPPFLRPLRWWEGAVRGRFEAEHDGSLFVVDAQYLDLDERIRLYRDGRLADVARRRAKFDIGPGARIEAAVAPIGMKYARLRIEGLRAPETLRPAEGTAEAWRARHDRDHPTASRIVALASLSVLIAVLAIELPQLVNVLGAAAPLLGLTDFGVPELTLPWWANTTLILLGGVAALERGLSMKYNAVLDG